MVPSEAIAGVELLLLKSSGSLKFHRFVASGGDSARICPAEPRAAMSASRTEAKRNKFIPWVNQSPPFGANGNENRCCAWTFCGEPQSPSKLVFSFKYQNALKFGKNRRNQFVLLTFWLNAEVPFKTLNVTWIIYPHDPFSILEERSTGKQEPQLPDWKQRIRRLWLHTLKKLRS